MKTENKRELLKRLSYVEGHLAGIRRMVEDEKYCVDILSQTHAVRKAIEKLEGMLLEGHLETCVPSGIREGREDQVIAELKALYAQAQR